MAGVGEGGLDAFSQPIAHDLGGRCRGEQSGHEQLCLAGRSCSSASNAWSAPGSDGRKLATSSTGRPSSRRARYARKRSEARSHQCRSSTASSERRSALRFTVSQKSPCRTANEPSPGGVARRARAAARRRRAAAPAAPASSAPARPRRREQRLEQLAHDAEGELPLQLAAARRAARAVRSRARGARLGEEPGLADPRRALDEDEARGPVRRGRRDRGRERFELALALEQRVPYAPGLRPTPACPHPPILGLRQSAFEGGSLGAAS